eukprot:m.113908 g.113908  ORF g.113908 m.113908 type:complete len:100 (-) comp10820_c0_seq2:463-762(-)
MPAPKAVPGLAHFVLRGEAIRLYRDCFRAIYAIDDADYRVYLKDWIRERFSHHRNESDAAEIKALVTQGRNEYNAFIATMNCAPTATHRTFRSSPPPPM